MRFPTGLPDLFEVSAIRPCASSTARLPSREKEVRPHHHETRVRADLRWIYRKRLIFARSINSSPRPLMIALSMNMPKRVACYSVCG